MRVGIICASDTELLPFLDRMEIKATSKNAMLTIHEGNIAGCNIVALYSGVCKVNAAIATQILIDHYSVNYIINAGVAGGINQQLNVLDTVISTEVTYHDVADDILTEYHPWMPTIYFKADSHLINLSKTAINKLDNMSSIHFGRIVTGESFIDREGREAIISKYAPLSVDMETASIAHVCYVNNIPFIAIRCISDTAKQHGNDVFVNNVDKASFIAANITIALLEELINN